MLANHVPSIEQLKPGLVEVFEESGGSKQFFCELAGCKTKDVCYMEIRVFARTTRGASL